VVHPRLHALLVAAVAAAVLGLNLGGPALWDDDEPKNAACSLAMLEANDWVVPTFNGRLRVEKPPLVNWLQIVGYTLCGRNETGARIGSALATAGTCLFTWRIGCLLLGPTAGLVGGLAMASCVWTAVGGRAATPDAPLLFCTTLALLFFVQAWHRDRQHGGGVRLRWTDAAAIGAACGAAVLAKGPVGIVLPLGAFAGFACLQPGGWHPRTWAARLAGLRLPLVVIVAAAVACPWYAWVTWRTDGEWLREFLFVHNIGRFAAPMEGHSGSLLYYPVVIAVGLFPWSIVLLAMVAHSIAILAAPDDDDDDRHASVTLLGCWALAWVGCFSCSGTKLPGYVWPAYPALALLTGLFLRDWAQGRVDCVRWCRNPARAIGRVMRVAWGSLALAGLALAVGLAVAAAIFAPGNEWLGLIGLVPIAAAAVAWRHDAAGHPGRAIRAVAVASCLLVSLLGGVAAERFSAAQGMRERITAIAADAPAAWACFWNVPPSVVFYARTTVAKLDTPHDVASHLAGHPQARVVIDSRHLERVIDAIPPHCGVIARIPTLAEHHYVVIGAKPTDVPLALNR
jgi:4-amino-4-deoxy-L-arabinose transferase-like glycosyltransferase